MKWHALSKQKLPLLYYTIEVICYNLLFKLYNGGETFKDGTTIFLKFFTWQRSRISLNQLVVIVFKKDRLELCFSEFLVVIING